MNIYISVPYQLTCSQIIQAALHCQRFLLTYVNPKTPCKHRSFKLGKLLIYFLFAILIILIISLIIYLARSNKIIQKEFQRQLDNRFNSVKNEIASYEKSRSDAFLKDWQTENEVNIRRQAIALHTRQITSEIAKETKLLNESFSYNPRDIKFIGKFIDLIVFDGAADEEEVSIYFLEITKANNGSTSEYKNKVWAAINKRKFNWKEINF